MLKEKITTALRQALKDKNTSQVSTLRMLLAEIHNREIAKRGELSDAELTKVLVSEKKKRQDSISQFQAGGRSDLVTQEQAELEIIESYLPPEISDEELRRRVREAVEAVQAGGTSDFGKVMKEVMQQVGSQAPGARVSQMVKEELNK